MNFSVKKLARFVTRAWYYFRTGYGTYLTFVLGVANTLTVLYYLLIRNIPLLEEIFPKFIMFSVIAVGIGFPLSTFVGWLHIKGTPAWAAEMDISVEANPYYYKLAPGIQREAYGPLYLELLRITRKIAENQKLLTNEEQNRIKDLERRLLHLIEGGQVGEPRRRPLS